MVTAQTVALERLQQFHISTVTHRLLDTAQYRNFGNERILGDCVRETGAISSGFYVRDKLAHLHRLAQETHAHARQLSPGGHGAG